MNKKITTILAALFMTGLVSAQVKTTTSETTTVTTPETTTVTTPATTTTTTTPATTTTAPATTTITTSTVTPTACAPNAACTPNSACVKGSMKKCCRTVLTEEERHRFCAAKAAAIAANPSLAKKGNKHALCDAIVKQDPTMEPILAKLKKHCEQMRQKCQTQSSCKSN